MPRVRPLTATQQRNEMNQKGNQAIADAAALYKLHQRKTDDDIGTVIGVHKQKVFRMRKNPGKENLDDIRIFAHAIGMTKDQWLMLGGF